MNKNVQLNDMELNQVAGGGLTEFFKKVVDFFAPHPTLPGLPKVPQKPDHMIPDPLPIVDR